MDEPAPDDAPSDVDAEKLDTKDREGLSKGTFAFPRLRKLPLNDAGHVRNALARFSQTRGMTPAEKSAARAAIHRAAKKFGIEVKAELDDDGDEDPPFVQAMSVEAMSLNVPDVPGHPNRMPFTGILVRLDAPSDRPPHGTDGKRIILTRAAAEQALPSLLGMGVDLKRDLDGHDAQNKVGIITSASIDGDAINIGGWIYCEDFPRHALAIQMNKADLGFSFEASNIRVNNLQDEILTIKGLTFTGCAVLLRDQAAYMTTALAASTAKEVEMTEIQDAVSVLLPDAVAKALEPITAALVGIAAAQAEQAAVLTELRKSPELRAVEANAAMCAMVEPHAKALEAVADGLETNHPPIGAASPYGYVHHVRRLVSGLRADASQGKLPHEYRDSGSYFAAQDNTKATTDPQPPQQTGDDDVNVQDDPEFIRLKASFDKQADELKKSHDTLASLATQIADIKASMAAQQPGPTRKTITPEIQQLLARAHISPTDIVDGAISLDKLDNALNASNVPLSQRMNLKAQLSRVGVLQNGFPVTNG